MSDTSTVPPYRSDYIFDFGMHYGLDTEYYLAKGFKVVAVEANPQMVEKALETLQPAVDSGNLIIEQVAIGPEPGTFTFYNSLDNDEWSTLDADRASTRGRFEQVQVQCITATQLFEKYGVPYYVKVDIEGMDSLVVEELANFSTQPKYLSIENGPIELMVTLHNAGWRKFKFLNMKEIWQIQLPNPPLEGAYTPHRFRTRSSGPFGEEVPGPWLNFAEAMHFYATEVRNPHNPRTDRWFDIHCTQT